MSHRKSNTYILRFLAFTDNDLESELFWKLQLTTEEAQIFNEELNEYSTWLNKYLSTGKAPDCSYEDPSIVAQLARNQTNKIRSRTFDFGFELWDLDEIPGENDKILMGYWEYIEYLIEEYEYRDGETEKGSLLFDILSRPYSDIGEPSYGYRTLPLTQELIEKDRFLQ